MELKKTVYYYDNSTQVRMLYHTDENHLLQGFSVVYNKDGSIDEKGHFKNNIQTGLWYHNAKFIYCL